MKKIDYLDGLRGLAALIVVINHFVVAFYPALYNGNINESHTPNAIEIVISKSPLNLLYNGNFAVCIFFVLSGYVLCYKFFKTKNIEIIISSVCRRYIRLLIPVLFSVIIVHLFMKFSLFYNQEAGNLSNSTWWLSTFWNFETSIKSVVKYAFIDVFFSHSDVYNTVLWTMSYEFYGSFLVLGSALFLARLKQRYIIYFFMLLYFLKSYYLAFIIGMILSDLINCKSSIIVKINNKLINTALLLMGLYFGSYPSGITVHDTIYSYLSRIPGSSIMFWHVVGASLVMISVLNSKTLQALFSRDVFIFIGKISFSMYLIHVIIIGSFTSYLITSFSIILPYNISVLFSFILSVPIILVLSYGMYKYVDTKSLLISNYFYNKYIKHIFYKESEMLTQILTHNVENRLS